VIYVGDSNVTVGKPFKIQCLSKVPIDWHKDDQLLQDHDFMRHSKDEFGYVKSDVTKENDMAESTLSVNHALLRHSGKYKCNIKHKNSHALYVNENDKPIEISVDDEDHLEVRVSFEPPIEEKKYELKSTMMIFMDDFSDSNSDEEHREPSTGYSKMTTSSSSTEPTTTVSKFDAEMTSLAASATNAILTTTQLPATVQPPKGSRKERKYPQKSFFIVKQYLSQMNKVGFVFL
jgi:hypothetical protein